MIMAQQYHPQMGLKRNNVKNHFAFVLYFLTFFFVSAGSCWMIVMNWIFSFFPRVKKPCLTLAILSPYAADMFEELNDWTGKLNNRNFFLFLKSYGFYTMGLTKLMDLPKPFFLIPIRKLDIFGGVQKHTKVHFRK